MKKVIIISIFLSLNFLVFSQDSKFHFDDTTKLRTKIIKLNSYFTFDTSAIDTNQRFIQFFDPYEKNRLPVANLGQIATPSLPLVFINRKENSDFLFFTPYSQYIYVPKYSEYYSTNKPFTDLEYVGILFMNKMREQQYLNLVHTQSPDKYRNFGIKYKLYTAMDVSNPPQNSAINNLNAWSFRQIKKYKIYFSIFYNQIKRLENGGIMDNDTSFRPYLYEKIQYYLSDVRNKMLYKGIFINQSYEFSKKLKLRYTTNYFTYSKIFTEKDPHTSYFGPTHLTKDLSYDSTGIRSLDNSLAVIFNKHENFIFAYTNKMQKLYYFRGFLYNLKGEYLADNILSFGIQKLKFKKFVFNFLGNYHFTDRNKGDFEIRNRNIYSLDFAHKTIFSLDIDYKKNTPDYFYENYNGNYYYWSNTFDDINSLSISFKSIFPYYHLQLGGNFREIKNYTYFDSLSMPAQDTNLLIVKTLWIRKTFSFSPFVLDLNLYYQLPNNQEVLHIPNYVASSSLFIDIPLFKNALHLNFGADVYYYSKFKTYGYNPAIGMFYLANDRISENYPVINAFLSAKIKTAIIIVRFDNAYGWLLSPYNETVEHYHISNFYLRFGVHWWFRN